MLHCAAQTVEEIEKNNVQKGIAAHGFGQQPGKQPPDLSAKDCGFVKAKQIIQKRAAIYQIGKGYKTAAQADIEHQIGDALVPVAETEPLKTAAKRIVQITQLPRNGFITFYQ